MAKVEVEVPDGAIRFLQSMQILWQLPQDWAKHYMSNAILKAIENDADSFLDKERLKELYGIGRMEAHELPANREVVTT